MKLVLLKVLCIIKFVILIQIKLVYGSTFIIDNGGLRHNKSYLIQEEPTTYCNNDEDCYENYTPGLEIALSYDATNIVHKPTCEKIKDERTDQFSKAKSSTGICTCGEWCKSHSTTTDNEKFYYCGSCGRVGSQCLNGTKCNYMSICINGYCECKEGGTFYDLYYCDIPYYGYKIILQMAVVTCILIASCLILVSAYNAIGFRRMRRIRNIRDLLRGGQGVRESPPHDTPPKYDDVIKDLPTYEDALENMKNAKESENGIVNQGFVDENNSETKDAILTVHNEDDPNENIVHNDENRPTLSEHIVHRSNGENNTGEQIVFNVKNTSNKDVMEERLKIHHIKSKQNNGKGISETAVNITMASSDTNSVS